ncbi:MAG: leucyl/phenylalanyl-tRNA--protein transferase, partial [Sphingobium yanoikuyae]
SMGAQEISQRDYLQLLGVAVGDVPLGTGDAVLSAGSGAAAELAFAPLAGDAAAGTLPLSPSLTVAGPLSGHSIVQLLTQTS